MGYSPQILAEETSAKDPMGVTNVLWSGITRDTTELRLPEAFHVAAAAKMKDKKWIQKVQTQFHIQNLRLDKGTFFFTLNTEFWKKDAAVRYMTKEEAERLGLLAA